MKVKIEAPAEVQEQAREALKRVNVTRLAQFYRTSIGTLYHWIKLRPEVLLAMVDWFTTFYPEHVRKNKNENTENTNETDNK